MISAGRQTPSEAQEAIPPGIPAAVKVVVAADMLGLSPATVRGWIDRETIDFRQDGRGRMRYVPTRELLRKANALGLEVDWERALE